MTRDPKPAKRYRATKAEWEALHLHFTAELCWLCGQAHDSLHHIYPRGQGGDDVRENLAPVCGNGTMGCHGLLEARDPWARSALRAALRFENLHYLARKLGDGRWYAWLERNYPRSAPAASSSGTASAGAEDAGTARNVPAPRSLGSPSFPGEKSGSEAAHLPEGSPPRAVSDPGVRIVNGEARYSAAFLDLGALRPVERVSGLERR